MNNNTKAIELQKFVIFLNNDGGVNLFCKDTNEQFWLGQYDTEVFFMLLEEGIGEIKAFSMLECVKSVVCGYSLIYVVRDNVYQIQKAA